MGAAKRGQEAGIAPGRSPPAQPRLPPEPKGLPEGARREPANGTSGTERQKTNRSSKLPWPASNASLAVQLHSANEEPSPVHELLQACP
jgi:hypothetical protein